MSTNEPTQGEKMADLASQASQRMADVEHTAHFLGVSRQAVHTNQEMVADMSAKAADQLRAEGN